VSLRLNNVLQEIGVQSPSPLFLLLDRLPILATLKIKINYHGIILFFEGLRGNIVRFISLPERQGVRKRTLGQRRHHLSGQLH
jgi:hypothetical protein